MPAGMYRIPKPKQFPGTLAGRQGAAYGGTTPSMYGRPTDSRILGGTPATRPFYQAPNPTAGPRLVAPQASPWKTDAQLAAEAQALANAQIQPLIDALNKSIAARAASGQAAISGLTGQLATDFGKYGPAVGEAYGTASKSIAGTEDALANRLSGQGSQIANTLSAALAQAGQNTAPTAALAGVGQGAGNASLAKGSASLDALLASAAAAKDYGAKLPGIAGLTGMQNTKEFQAQLNSELASKLDSLTAQSPGLVQSILSGLYSRQGQQQALAQNRQAQARTVAANKTSLYQHQAEVRSAQTGNIWVATNTGIHPLTDKAGNPVPIGYSPAQKASIAKTRATAGAKVITAAAKAGQPNPSLSRVFGYVVDSNGNPILRGGRTVPVASKAGKGPGAPRPNVQLSRALGQWVDANGNPIPQLNKAGVPKPPPTVGAKTNTTGKSVFGTAPHKNNQGVWVTKTGKPLSPGGSAYWDSLQKRGLTDSAGHVTKPPRPKAPKTAKASTTPPWARK